MILVLRRKKAMLTFEQLNYFLQFSTFDTIQQSDILLVGIPFRPGVGSPGCISVLRSRLQGWKSTGGQGCRIQIADSFHVGPSCLRLVSMGGGIASQEMEKECK